VHREFCIKAFLQSPSSTAAHTETVYRTQSRLHQPSSPRIESSTRNVFLPPGSQHTPTLRIQHLHLVDLRRNPSMRTRRSTTTKHRSPPTMCTSYLSDNPWLSRCQRHSPEPHRERSRPRPSNMADPLRRRRDNIRLIRIDRRPSPCCQLDPSQRPLVARKSRNGRILRSYVGRCRR
jgi:hypothetical protein